MSQAALAAAAEVAPMIAARAEATNGPPLMGRFENRAVRRAVEATGVEFVDRNGGRAGGRLRKTE